MIDRIWAEKFAQEWIDAWNAHDLERIFLLYAGDFEMTSPLIIERMHVANGRLKDKSAIRPYWSQGLVSTPNLHFELQSVMVGVNSIAILYASLTSHRQAIEIFEFDDQRRVVRSQVLHGPV